MQRLPTDSYRRLLGYLAPSRPALIAALLASCVAAAAGAFYAYLIGPLLRAVLTGGAITLGRWSWSGAELLTRLPLVVIAVAIVKAFAQWLQGGLMQGVGQAVMVRLRRHVFERLLQLPPRFFETRHSGELLSRFTSDVAQVEFAVTQALASYVKDSLQVLAQLAVCFAIDRRLFVLAFVVVPAAAIPVSRFARALKKVATRTQASLGRITELAAEQLHNLAVVQSFRAEDRALLRFEREQSGYLEVMRRSLFIRGAFTPTLEVMGIAGAALAIGFGARAIDREPELAGKLLSFLAASLLMYQPLKALSGTFSLVMQGVGAAGRLFEIVDAPADADAGDEAPPLSRALTLEDVVVSYDGERRALDGLTLEVRAGKRTALVGASGAGKTTVFSVLLRFVTPLGGRVLWDGSPLEALRPSSVRRRIAWVAQEPMLFSGSVRDNVRLARPEATDAEIWEALERAHAAGFVRALRGALEENVGEKGSRLSGGQRQRLAIARALLARPSLLLLDEPTSALDAESEREVQAGLDALMAERTTLVIAHRLSTVRDADEIAVLEAGRLVERGTHDELLARQGRYAQLLARGELG